MNCRALYERLEENYNDVLNRFGNDDRIERFMLKFLDDKTFDLLITSYGKNESEAFRAAHTMKGIAQNFAFEKLYSASYELCESLRPGTPKMENEAQLMQNVETEYLRVVAEIKSAAGI